MQLLLYVPLGPTIISRNYLVGPAWYGRPEEVNMQEFGEAWMAREPLKKRDVERRASQWPSALKIKEHSFQLHLI